MIEELQAQLATAQQGLIAAQAAGLEYETPLHRARIDDLIEIAMRSGIDGSRPDLWWLMLGG